ncbi:MAG TPA: 23S rRNA (adenine(2030)-N(6))-methyltransferase RlmJ [Steroidobacteraceae bacterium]|jgi:23S rRNA (adenine2030-N6)-methyltransferase
MAKYRHSHHAGNFADVHKHVTLRALLSSMKRKDKGFAYFETHAGRGAYHLSPESPETAHGVGRFMARAHDAPELREFAAAVLEFRRSRGDERAYPGSPVIAASELRPQDRALFGELIPAEARALERELEGNMLLRVEQGDGFERLRAWMPPAERRALVLIDPPYEETLRDFERVTAALNDALRRFATGVYMVWYPIKDERQVRAWHSRIMPGAGREMLASEMWLYPRDSRVALNGSGLLVVNPPWQLLERMRTWLPELQALLDTGHEGGTSVTKLTSAA